MNASGIAAMAAIVSVAGAASGQVVGTQLYTITATNNNGTSTMNVVLGASAGITTVMNGGGDTIGFTWNVFDAFGGDLTFANGAKLLQNSTFGVTSTGNSAQIDINFTVNAANGDTTFTVTSGQVVAGTFDNTYEGSAAFSLTDTESFGGLATASAGDPALGGDFFGLLFDGSLIATAITGPFSTTFSVNGNGDFNGAFAPTVNSASAVYSVTVTEDDIFAGNATAFITGIPTPGTFAVVVAGGLLSARRRR